MKTIYFIIIAALLAGGLPGCESSSAPQPGEMLFTPSAKVTEAPPAKPTAAPPPTPAKAKPDTPRRQYISLKLQWQPQAQFAGYIMAMEKNYFKEAGIKEFQLLWYQPGDSPLEQLAAGEIDFCTGWFSDAIYRRENGLPIVLLAQIMDRSAMMLVTRKKDNINSPQDMTGHRVGIWGGDFSIPPKAFFQKYRVRPELIQQTNSIQPFMRHAVDVASAMYYNEYHSLFEAGLEPEELVIFELADYGLDFPEDGLYCTQALRQKRPDLCKAVSIAVQKGWQYAFDHEDETLRTVMQYCKKHKVNTNINHQRWMLRAMKKFIHPKDEQRRWGDLPAGQFKKVVEILQSQGILKNPPSYTQFFKPTERLD